ncbi:MAG: hypothetical protein ONB44_04120 [candidate division KSB1 bacterium]|nr:hypothetical protein [candidate division KSB1 bacterium]MDZ7301317.1 hypothetical protein [candidate division KSB1 bacterium]MDZ7310798.1 hypothetical protein [candidate division KSB1 bacterium]
MAVDLLTISDHEPPMGDLFSNQSLSFCRALWTTPIEGEEDAPRHRIIHIRVLQLHGPARIFRLGLRPAKGYHKCGSYHDLDWVASFRVLVWQNEQWQVHAHEKNVMRPEHDAIRWYELGGIVTSAIIIEVRRCGIDNWWPSWNLVGGALILEGEPLSGVAPRKELTHTVEKISSTNLPAGLTMEQTDGEIRYRSRFLQVGFYLNRAGFSYLSIDEEGNGKTSQNILHLQPGSFHQGLRFHPIGGPPIAAPTLRYQVQGTTRVDGHRVIYDLALAGSAQHYHLEWEVQEDRLLLQATRTGQRPVQVWNSSAWYIGLRPTISPAHVIGRIIREGETGLLTLPILLHVPRFGTLSVEANNEHALWRSDAFRPLDMTSSEIKLGEIPQPQGGYLLPAGEFRTTLQMALTRAEIPMKEGTPSEIVQAVAKTAFTALTYRPDTATLSNNGASIHCPICMDNWSAITTRLGDVLPNLPAVELLRTSLERWLDGGQGYTSGRMLQHGKFHEAEDEYLLTGAACLLGLGEYLRHSGTVSWIEQYHDPIRQQLQKMRARDVDGDGLVESIYRTGVSGTGQWSTCWFDVISFGWKDAFSNAILYRALVVLAEIFPKLEANDLATGLSDWAEKLRANYRPTFFNPQTGWLAGWRCAENKLHDYAFLFVNGAAVSGGLLDYDDARAIIGKLWEETKHAGMPDPLLGLPGNLWSIPDEDRSDIMQGYPMGYYQNGGRTHSQARHFVNALYRVGMTEEADYLLRRLCEGLARGLVYGGNKSGLDWRFWDDRPCGYEGLLSDQFGVLATALEQYGESR